MNTLYQLLHKKLHFFIAFLFVFGTNVEADKNLQVTDERPNIIVIIADDMGWNDIGYNNEKIQTPNLDKLAFRGIRFNQFYVYSTCSPSRVALQTGQNPATFNVFGPLGSTTEVEPKDMLLTFGLKKAGYNTHLSGKWHIGDEPEHRPLQYGYDSTYGYLRGQIDPYTHRYKYGNYVTWHRNDQFIDEDGHVTKLITDEAIRVIQEHAKKDNAKPFFLHIAHHAPHFPHNSSPKWIEPYEQIFDDPWRQHTAATITQMDYEIGRILDVLEATSERQNTLIVFMSDNGGQKSWGAPIDEYNGRYAPHTTLGDNTPFRGWKTDLYEGGIRVPAFVNWVGKIPEGSKIDSPVHVLDLAPTLLSLANSDLMSDDRLEGKNLWPFITREKSQSELNDRLFYWRQSDTRAIRENAWKLIAQGDSLTNAELFNIKDDPLEHYEIGDRYPDKRDQLLDLIREWEEWNILEE